MSATALVAHVPESSDFVESAPASIALQGWHDDEVARHRERGLFRRCRDGDTSAREALVERFLPLAASMAQRYARSGEPMDDLVQVARLGLVKAVDRFDPERGLRFSSFAIPTILGELKRHFRGHTWAVHVPRSLGEMVLRVDAAVAEMTSETGVVPTVADLAEALEATDEQILDALQARAARRAGSLDAPVASTEPDTRLTVGDTLDSARARRDREESDARVMLAPLLVGLDDRERRVLRLRFEDDLTQAEIGELVGVSQMQVSRIIRQCLDRLRHAAESR